MILDSAALLMLLPRLECGQCGYAGCAPYAEALISGEAEPAACTPGGAYVAYQLSQRLGLPSSSAQAVLSDPLPAPQIARIDEGRCIGCTKCIEACPVDAIVGAAHQLHGILDDLCTGCGLCLPPCPVDCILMMPADVPATGWPALATPPASTLRTTEAAPCTACGDCEVVCATKLSPGRLLGDLQQLDFAAALENGLSRCTVCGACDAVCPSRIPLSAYFAQAQITVAAVEHMTQAAVQAADRVAARARRLGQRATAPVSLPALETISGAAASTEIEASIMRARLSVRPALGRD